MARRIQYDPAPPECGEVCGIQDAPCCPSDSGGGGNGSGALSKGVPDSMEKGRMFSHDSSDIGPLFSLAHFVLRLVPSFVDMGPLHKVGGAQPLSR